jgi:hypothetical protein
MWTSQRPAVGSSDWLGLLIFPLQQIVMETFCQLSDFLITRLSEWLKKPEYGFARPLCEEKGVCDLGQLAVMQLRICKGSAAKFVRISATVGVADPAVAGVGMNNSSSHLVGDQ